MDSNLNAREVSYEEFVALARDYYGTVTIVFDSDLAIAVLEGFNSGNRRVSEARLQDLVEQMTSGRFENTGEPLIVAAEGILNDGQLRLLAIVIADTVVSMDVRFGIPRERHIHTNTGLQRTAADVLSIKGVPRAGLMARTIHLLIAYDCGLPSSNRRFVSNDQIARGFDDCVGITEVADRVAKQPMPRGFRGAPLLATSYLASLSRHQAKLDDWLRILGNGIAASTDNPVYFAREYILRNGDSGKNASRIQLERFALFICTWNAFASAQSVSAKDLLWKLGACPVEPFPILQDVKSLAFAESANSS